MSMKEYTEEFHNLNIRVGHGENNEDKFVTYINSLSYEIQDESCMVTMRTLEDDYQVALNVEEKLARQQS
jgi:hypothetical protein